MNLATKLTPAQRIDMIQKGLSPLSNKHIQKYFENDGKISLSEADKIQKVQNLIGQDIPLTRNLGSSLEKDSDYGQIPGLERNGPAPKNERESLMSDLDYYSGSGSINKSISSDSLLSLKKGTKQRINEAEDERDYKKVGYDLSIKYLNAFILNLKSPSSKGRLEVYKHLKKLFETEIRLKSKPNSCSLFKEGCKEAENLMYTQLTQ